MRAVAILLVVLLPYLVYALTFPAAGQVFLSLPSPSAPAGGGGTSNDHFNTEVGSLDGAGLVFALALGDALTMGGAETGYSGHVLGAGSLSFNSGGTADVDDGQTIVGETSGASAAVISVHTTGGTWAGGDVVGVLHVGTVTGGPFQNGENICVTSCGTQMATLTSALVTTDAAKIGAQIHRDDYASGDGTCSNASSTTICSLIAYQASPGALTLHWTGDLGSAGGQIRPNISGVISGGALDSPLITGHVWMQFEFRYPADLIANHASDVNGWAEQKIALIHDNGGTGILVGAQYSGANGVWLDSGPDANTNTGIQPADDEWIRATIDVDIDAEDVDVWIQREQDSTATKVVTDRTYGNGGGDAVHFHLLNNSSGHDDTVLQAHDRYVAWRNWIVSTAQIGLGEDSIGD